MKNYFEIIDERISKEDLLASFTEHEASRSEKDQFAHEIIKRLQQSNELNYSRCLLLEEGFLNLAMPHHGHEINIVPPGGESLATVLSKVDVFDKESECITKILNIKDSLFSNASTVWKTPFLLCSNDKELVHPNHYHNAFGNGKLYIANGFHRWVAYGLALREFKQFIPLNVYYGENVALHGLSEDEIKVVEGASS